MKRCYIVYDGRAAHGDTEHATCLVALGSFDTQEQAFAEVLDCKGRGMEFCLYSYAEDRAGNLTDERLERYHAPETTVARRQTQHERR